MTVKNRIAQHIQKMRTAEELNPYVHELLLARLDSLTEHYNRHGSIEEVIRQEYEHFHMEWGYSDYGTCLVPITQAEALEQFDDNCGVLLVYPDNTEGYCQNREDIVSGDFCYANEVNEPQSLLYLIEPEPQPAPKMVYIASPLRGDYNENIKNAVEYCKNACDLGVMGLAPHIIFSQWCNDTIPEQREQGLKLGLSLLQKSEELWVMGQTISEGMHGEIAFAKAQGIPIFYIEHPHDPQYYPVSADGNTLLNGQDCIADSHKEDYSGKMVILHCENLRMECRTPINQIWKVTHGPGCRPDYIHSDTIHLRHPIDGDRMAVGRSDVYGIAKSDVFEKLARDYLEFIIKSQSTEQNEELCR